MDFVTVMLMYISIQHIFPFEYYYHYLDWLCFAVTFWTQDLELPDQNFDLPSSPKRQRQLSTNLQQLVNSFLGREAARNDKVNTAGMLLCETKVKRFFKRRKWIAEIHAKTNVGSLLAFLKMNLPDSPAEKKTASLPNILKTEKSYPKGGNTQYLMTRTFSKAMLTILQHFIKHKWLVVFQSK